MIILALQIDDKKEGNGSFLSKIRVVVTKVRRHIAFKPTVLSTPQSFEPKEG